MYCCFMYVVSLNLFCHLVLLLVIILRHSEWRTVKPWEVHTRGWKGVNIVQFQYNTIANAFNPRNADKPSVFQLPEQIPRGIDMRL
jgi:hypothetical protein